MSEKVHILRDFEDDVVSHLQPSKTVQFIQNNLKLILLSVAVLVSLSLSLGVYLTSKAAKDQKAILNCIQISEKLHQGIRDKDDLLQLEKVLLKHPLLKSRFAYLLTQCLVEENELEKAEEFARLSLPLDNSESKTFYSQFTETTLLINKGDYEKALASSLALKEKIPYSLTALNGLNRLRIAFLHKEMQNHSLMLKELNELQDHISKSDGDHFHLDNFKKSFENSGLSLMDFTTYERKH